jgi:hypothetical protein
MKSLPSLYPLLMGTTVALLNFQPVVVALSRETIAQIARSITVQAIAIKARCKTPARRILERDCMI